MEFRDIDTVIICTSEPDRKLNLINLCFLFEQSQHETTYYWFLQGNEWASNNFSHIILKTLNCSGSCQSDASCIYLIMLYLVFGPKLSKFFDFSYECFLQHYLQVLNYAVQYFSKYNANLNNVSLSFAKFLVFINEILFAFGVSEIQAYKQR